MSFIDIVYHQIHYFLIQIAAVDNGEYFSHTLLTREVRMIFSTSISIISDWHSVSSFSVLDVSSLYNEDGNICEIELLSFVPNYIALDTDGSNETIVVTPLSQQMAGAQYRFNKTDTNSVACLFKDRCLSLLARMDIIS